MPYNFSPQVLSSEISAGPEYQLSDVWQFFDQKLSGQRDEKSTSEGWPRAQDDSSLPKQMKDILTATPTPRKTGCRNILLVRDSESWKTFMHRVFCERAALCRKIVEAGTLRLITVLIIGVAVRLAIAPFFAHPFDVYSWYLYGENVLTGKESLWAFLQPYRYAFFLFAFPTTALFNFLGHYIQTYTLQMSSLDPTLNPGPQWNILVVPGLLFDLLVKIPLIISDTLIAYLLYELVAKHVGNVRLAIITAAFWFLNPLTIWISSGWGAFDTLASLFTVLAFYLAMDKKFAFAGISLVASTAMKYYAVVLIIPLLILALRRGGKKEVLQVLGGVGISSVLLFSPFLSVVVSGFASVGIGTSTSALHYSGLSFWNAFTLFFSNFDQIEVSLGFVVASLTIIYLWMWRSKSFATGFFSSALFFFPLLAVLLFFRFVGENFFIWLLPFVSIFCLKDAWTRRLYWILSAIALVSSVTDSLLPYYMLPTSPWIGSWLVHIMDIISPYRIASGGSISQGFSAGKIFLSLLGIASAVTLILMALRLYKQRSSLDVLLP